MRRKPPVPAPEELSSWDDVTEEVAQLPIDFVIWQLEPVLGAGIVTYMVGELGRDIGELPEWILQRHDEVMRLRLALRLVKLMARSLEQNAIREWFRGGELLVPGSPADQVRGGFTRVLEGRLRRWATQLTEEYAAQGPA